MDNILNEKIGIHDSIRIKCIEKGLEIKDVLDDAGVKYATFKSWKTKEPNCIGQIHKLNKILL